MFIVTIENSLVNQFDGGDIWSGKRFQVCHQFGINLKFNPRKHDRKWCNDFNEIEWKKLYETENKRYYRSSYYRYNIFIMYIHIMIPKNIIIIEEYVLNVLNKNNILICNI